MSYDSQVMAVMLVMGMMVAGFVGLIVGRSQGNPLSGMGESEFRKFQQMSEKETLLIAFVGLRRGRKCTVQRRKKSRSLTKTNSN